MNKLLSISAAVLVAMVMLSGCGSIGGAAATATPQPTATPQATATPQPTATPLPFALTSTAFEEGAAIPERYGCTGVNVSPPLAWSGAPAGTASFALVMDDPDAVPVVGYVWDHWLLFNIPAATQSLPEDVPQDSELPDGSRHGRNSFVRNDYGGPCPPSGVHRYVFTLYALGTTLDLPAGSDKTALLQAIKDHTLAQTQLTGLYGTP